MQPLRGGGKQLHNRDILSPLAVGARVASLNITDNASGSPHSVPLSGKGMHDVILSWTDSATPAVIGYYVYRGSASGGPYTKLNTTPATGTAYTDNNVQAGQTYYYVSTALDSNNAESVYSNHATAVIPTP